MGNPWLETSKKNLLPLSSAGTFSVALQEWSFTGDVVDHEEPVESCELCEHEQLRYHYEIHNTTTDHSLWVGSSCILRFEEINVYDDDGSPLTCDEKRKKQLEKALREKQVSLMLEPLRKLWRSSNVRNREYIENAVRFFQKKGAFSPKSLAILFGRLLDHEIPFKAEQFPVYLRSNYSKEQLEQMDDNLLELIRPALTKEQIARFPYLQ